MCHCLLANIGLDSPHFLFKQNAGNAKLVSLLKPFEGLYPTGLFMYYIKPLGSRAERFVFGGRGLLTQGGTFCHSGEYEGGAQV